MKEETYRKVFIKDESDYPKENGLYFCVDQNRHYIGERSFDKDDKINLHIWSGVDWYLQPVTAKTEQETVELGTTSYTDKGNYSVVEQETAAIERAKFIREQATSVMELTKGFSTNPIDNAMATLLEFTYYILELTSSSWQDRCKRVSAEKIRDKYSRLWFNETDDIDDPNTGYMAWPDVLKAMKEYERLNRL